MLVFQICVWVKSFWMKQGLKHDKVSMLILQVCCIKSVVAGLHMHFVPMLPLLYRLAPTIGVVWLCLMSCLPSLCHLLCGLWLNHKFALTACGPCWLLHVQAAPLADIIAFNKIKKKLGGRVRLILSGAAPLSTPVQQVLSCCMCAPVLQGYGLTETCASSTIAEPYKWDTIGTVGGPMPGKLASALCLSIMHRVPDACFCSCQLCRHVA